MVVLTRINGTEFILNDRLIETIESTMDTVINLTNGKFVIVQESPEEIVQKVIEYNRKLLEGIGRPD